MSSEPQTGPMKSSLSSGYAGAREAIQSDSPAGRAALFVVGNWCLLGEVDLAPIYLAWWSNHRRWESMVVGKWPAPSNFLRSNQILVAWKCALGSAVARQYGILLARCMPCVAWLTHKYTAWTLNCTKCALPLLLWCLSFVFIQLIYNSWLLMLSLRMWLDTSCSVLGPSILQGLIVTLQKQDIAVKPHGSMWRRPWLKAHVPSWLLPLWTSLIQVSPSVSSDLKLGDSVRLALDLFRGCIEACFRGEWSWWVRDPTLFAVFCLS